METNLSFCFKIKINYSFKFKHKYFRSNIRKRLYKISKYSHCGPIHFKFLYVYNSPLFYSSLFLSKVHNVPMTFIIILVPCVWFASCRFCLGMGILSHPSLQVFPFFLECYGDCVL